MIKVTCIVGSARNNGSCACLADAFINGLRGRAQIRKYCVGDIDLHFCKGCKNCYQTGECVTHDDVQTVISHIMTSDYVFMAAPSYWAGVPAQIKALFDRTTPYGDTNPKRIIKPKDGIKGIAVAVRAGTRQAENELILNSIDHYFGHLGIETVKKISVLQTDNLSDLHEKNAQVIAEVTRIGEDIANKKL